MNKSEEIEVTHYILDMVKEYQLRILTYNICQDHVHLVLVCQKDKHASIIGKLKGKSSTLYKKKRGIEEPFHLWGQKYNHRPVKNDKYLYNLLEYIKNNRQKHNLATNKEIQILAEKMCISVEEAFSDSDNN